MKLIRDKTGRFPQRPLYPERELDDECERVITAFMIETCGKFSLPIPTDVLTKLIERDAEDLDLYADLSSEGPDVQGVTDFVAGRKPRVRILAALSEQQSENRLRTTLTHEWGHVWFHNYLWQIEASNPSHLAQLKGQPSPRCKRDLILGASSVDWMEWQAGYVCGSVLMPRTRVVAKVRQFCDQHSVLPPVYDRSVSATSIITFISREFAVSTDAARVRLAKLGILTDKDPGPSLF